MEQYLGPLFLALPLLLLWMLISRTRRQQRILAAAQSSIEPGLWVMTTSGLQGQVVSVDDGRTVLLEIAPGVHTRWARQAIAEVLPQDPASSVSSGAVVDLAKGDRQDQDPHPDDRDDRTHN